MEETTSKGIGWECRMKESQKRSCQDRSRTFRSCVLLLHHATSFRPSAFQDCDLLELNSRFFGRGFAECWLLFVE